MIFLHKLAIQAAIEPIPSRNQAASSGSDLSDDVSRGGSRSASGNPMAALRAGERDGDLHGNMRRRPPTTTAFASEVDELRARSAAAAVSNDQTRPHLREEPSAAGAIRSRTHEKMVQTNVQMSLQLFVFTGRVVPSATDVPLLDLPGIALSATLPRSGVLPTGIKYTKLTLQAPAIVADVQPVADGVLSFVELAVQIRKVLSMTKPSDAGALPLPRSSALVPVASKWLPRTAEVAIDDLRLTLLRGAVTAPGGNTVPSDAAGDSADSGGAALNAASATPLPSSQGNMRRTGSTPSMRRSDSAQSVRTSSRRALFGSNQHSDGGAAGGTSLEGSKLRALCARRHAMVFSIHKTHAWCKLQAGSTALQGRAANQNVNAAARPYVLTSHLLCFHFMNLLYLILACSASYEWSARMDAPTADLSETPGQHLLHAEYTKLSGHGHTPFTLDTDEEGTGRSHAHSASPPPSAFSGGASSASFAARGTPAPMASPDLAGSSGVDHTMACVLVSVALHPSPAVALWIRYAEHVYKGLAGRISAVQQSLKESADRDALNNMPSAAVPAQPPVMLIDVRAVDVVIGVLVSPDLLDLVDYVHPADAAVASHGRADSSGSTSARRPVVNTRGWHQRDESSPPELHVLSLGHLRLAELGLKTRVPHITAASLRHQPNSALDSSPEAVGRGSNLHEPNVRRGGPMAGDHSTDADKVVSEDDRLRAGATVVITVSSITGDLTLPSTLRAHQLRMQRELGILKIPGRFMRVEQVLIDVMPQQAPGPASFIDPSTPPVVKQPPPCLHMRCKGAALKWSVFILQGLPPLLKLVRDCVPIAFAQFGLLPPAPAGPDISRASSASTSSSAPPRTGLRPAMPPIVLYLTVRDTTLDMPYCLELGSGATAAPQRPAEAAHPMVMSISFALIK